MNHITRTRDKKRKSYNELLKYIDKNKHKYNCYVRREKKDYLDLILNVFPHLNNELLNCSMNYYRRKEAARKFNGELVRSWIPYINGEQLGKVIANFKNVFSDFESEILDMSDMEIKHSFICSLYEKNS